MRRHVLVAALSIALAAAVLAAFPAGRALADGIQSVIVTNFPRVFSVDGAVSIKGPVRIGTLVTKRDVVVPPIGPKDTTRLIDGGTIETEGFSAMVLSLAGQVKGESLRAGSVGAILLPDDELIVRAFDERGLTPFALEVAASGVSGATPYFASNQPRHTIAFARYRVYFYNSSDKTVTANLYAYLTN